MPKPLSGDIYAREIRITPYDQQPITESDLQPYLPDIDKLLLCQEGSPNGTPKLHYHGFIETKKSETWVRSIMRKIAHCEDKGVNGNVLFFTRKPHDHTYGYIVKSGNIAHNTGYTQTTLDNWLAESDDYRKSKETARKRQQRSREDQLGGVVEQVKSDLQTNNCGRTAHDVISRVLMICHQEDIRFPAKSQMDSIVLKLLYPYDEYLVRSYYAKSFDAR